MNRCKHCASMPFETTYRKNGKHVEYRTQAPTMIHARIRAMDPRACSGRLDFNVSWPFGAFKEITVPSANTKARKARSVPV